MQSALDGAAGERRRLALKWPNDVLVDGAKVAGILLEAVDAAGGGSDVVIGIGVNVRHAPEGMPYPATSLADCGADVDRRDALRGARARPGSSRKRSGTRAAALPRSATRWLERAAGLGAPIAVKLGDDVFAARSRRSTTTAG